MFLKRWRTLRITICLRMMVSTNFSPDPLQCALPGSCHCHKESSYPKVLTQLVTPLCGWQNIFTNVCDVSSVLCASMTDWYWYSSLGVISVCIYILIYTYSLPVPIILSKRLCRMWTFRHLISALLLLLEALFWYESFLHFTASCSLHQQWFLHMLFK